MRPPSQPFDVAVVLGETVMIRVRLLLAAALTVLVVVGSRGLDAVEDAASRPTILLAVPALVLATVLSSRRRAQARTATEEFADEPPRPDVGRGRGRGPGPVATTGPDVEPGRPWSHRVDRTVVGLQVLLDAVALFLALASMPGRAEILWPLLVVPVVEAGLAAGVGASALAWTGLAGALWFLTERSLIPLDAAQIDTRVAVLLVIAAPLGFLGRALLVATADAAAHREVAARRAADLELVAREAARIMRPEQRDVELAVVEAAVRLGAAAIEVWRGDESQDWTRTQQAGAPMCPGRPVWSVPPVGEVGPPVGASADHDDPLERVFRVPGEVDHPGLALRVVPSAERQDDDGFTEALALLGAQAAAALGHARMLQGLVAVRDQLAADATTDALTGLPNRTALLGGLAAACEPSLPDAALLFIDLDGFKQVNDTLGHAAGDRILQAAATRFASTVRAGDLLARLGGDEFCVLVHTGVTTRWTDALSARLIASLDGELADGIRLSASIGVAMVRPGDGPSDVLAAADAAMYATKRARAGQAMSERS